MSDVRQNGDREIIFRTNDGRRFSMHHSQDCCENVYIESVAGDLGDLVGVPIMIAEEVYEEPVATLGWTFYKFATQKGYVTIRWCGSSNGDYSVRVNVYEVREESPQ